MGLGKLNGKSSKFIGRHISSRSIFELLFVKEVVSKYLILFFFRLLIHKNISLLLKCTQQSRISTKSAWGSVSDIMFLQINFLLVSLNFFLLFLIISFTISIPIYFIPSSLTYCIQKKSPHGASRKD